MKKYFFLLTTIVLVVVTVSPVGARDHFSSDLWLEYIEVGKDLSAFDKGKWGFALECRLKFTPVAEMKVGGGFTFQTKDDQDLRSNRWWIGPRFTFGINKILPFFEAGLMGHSLSNLSHSHDIDGTGPYVGAGILWSFSLFREDVKSTAGISIKHAEWEGEDKSNPIDGQYDVTTTIVGINIDFIFMM